MNFRALKVLFIALAAAFVLPSFAQAGTPWYFTIHASEMDYSLTKADTVLQKAKYLNGKGARTDVFWFDVEPTRDVWDNSKFQFYTSYVSKVRYYGLDPLIILSGAPQWAIDLYNSDKNAFWAEYEEYVEQVILWIGDRVDNYQMWNEANHMVDPIASGDDWELFARAGAIIDDLDPTARTFVNVMADLAGWEGAVTSWIDLADDYIDVIAIDHYPGTWAAGSWTNWQPLDRLTTRINTPGDAWYGNSGAILETGFSSWAWLIADEYDQRDWFNQSLPVVRNKVNANNSTKPFKIVAGGIYQLVDTCTDQFNPSNCHTGGVYGTGIEAHFGAIHSNYTDKVGTNALKSQLGQM